MDTVLTEFESGSELQTLESIERPPNSFKIQKPSIKILQRIDVLPKSNLKMYVPIDEQECVKKLLENQINREDVFTCDFNKQTENEKQSNNFLSICKCESEEPVLALPLYIKIAKLKEARKNVENYRIVGAGRACEKKKHKDNGFEGLRRPSKFHSSSRYSRALRAIDAPLIRASANENYEQIKLSNIPRESRIANAQLLGETYRSHIKRFNAELGQAISQAAQDECISDENKQFKQTFLIPKRLRDLHNFLEDRKVQITPQHVLLTKALLPEYLCDNDKVIYLTPAKVLQLLNDLQNLLQNCECINDSGLFILEAIAYCFKNEKSWTTEQMPSKINKLITALTNNKSLDKADLLLGKYLVGNDIFSGNVLESDVEKVFQNFSEALSNSKPLSSYNYNIALTLGIIPSLLTDELTFNETDNDVPIERKYSTISKLCYNIKRKFLGLRSTSNNNNQKNTKSINTKNSNTSITEGKTSTPSQLSSIQQSSPAAASIDKLTTAGEHTVKTPYGNINTSEDMLSIENTSSKGSINSDKKKIPLYKEIDDIRATVLDVNKFPAPHIIKPRTLEQYDYYKWLDYENNSILNFKQPNKIPNRFAITEKYFKEITEPYRLKSKINNNAFCDFAEKCKHSMQLARIVKQRLIEMKRFYDC